MKTFEKIVRGGSVVTPAGVREADIGIGGGKIQALETSLAGDASEVIDATGLHVLPGLIDAHVHFNEPGREQWEGLETGSRALAAGGGTLFFDMPLNAHPPTVDAENFRLKLAAAERKSLVDFAFWGGLVPGNLDHLEALAGCGVVGFKAFMANSGIDDFACVDAQTLCEGMKRAARLRLPVAVHAESDTLTQELARERIASGRTSVRDYLDSRPVAAELDAIRCALDLAGETGCALHVVHVSCGAGVRLIAEARRRGVNVSCETCPHYLVLTEEDVERIGALAKCAPPLRSAAAQAELWECLLAGEIDTLGSDHSPSPPEMKQDANFFRVWGGISGVQHTLPLMLTALELRGKDAGMDQTAASSSSSSFSSSSSGLPVLHVEDENKDEDEHESSRSLRTSSARQDLPLPLLAGLLSERVAKRFNLPAAKGRLAVGADADLALVRLEETFEVKIEDLLYRHRQTPYVGRKLRGRVIRTLLRGQTVFKDGKIAPNPIGQLVKPGQ
jgi:allantoinase